MDLTKKRKLDDNGVVSANFDYKLSPEDVRKIIDPFTQDQLLEILQNAVVRHLDVLDSVRSIADRDPTQRKLFIRGLGWETTTEGLRNIFSAYGDLDEAIVILDKGTGKSKGYGFVTFKHIDGALLALKEPSKKIDGRMTVTQLASAGMTAGGPTVGNLNAAAVESRKIYVANVPYDMPGERLLSHFLSYGEVEEGPLGFDKATGKSKGFALFVYKTAEAARAALVDPIKTIDGHQMSCKFANEGKKGKPAPGAQAPPPSAGQGQVQGSGGANIDQQQNVDGHGLNQAGSVPMPGSFLSHYGGGVPGGIMGYGGGGLQGQNQNPLVHSHHPGSLNSGMTGGPGLPSLGGGGGGGAGAGVGAGLSLIGNQVPSSLGGNIGGFGSGPYGGSHFGGPGPTYSGLGGSGGGLSGAAAGGLGGFGGGIGGGTGIGLNVSGRGSLYGLPPSSGGFPESAHYSLSSGSVYQNQHHQPTGTSSLNRVPPGGMYQGHGMPPYY